jgi:hypothetical protein
MSIVAYSFDAAHTVAVGVAVAVAIVLVVTVVDDYNATLCFIFGLCLFFFQRVCVRAGAN